MLSEPTLDLPRCHIPRDALNPSRNGISQPFPCRNFPDVFPACPSPGTGYLCPTRAGTSRLPSAPFPPQRRFQEHPWCSQHDPSCNPWDPSCCHSQMAPRAPSGSEVIWDQPRVALQRFLIPKSLNPAFPKLLEPPLVPAPSKRCPSLIPPGNFTSWNSGNGSGWKNPPG